MNTEKTTPGNQHSTLKIVVLTTLITMLVLVLGFHILLPLLGISVIISANMWGVAITTVVIMCIASLLFFVFTGVAMILIGVCAGLFVILAVTIFPLLFPLLAPLLLLMIAIAFLIRRKK